MRSLTNHYIKNGNDKNNFFCSIYNNKSTIISYDSPANKGKLCQPTD